MISLAEFKKRRKLLQTKLPKDGIAIIPGASEQVRNHDVHYPFRQNSHFLYLTGFSEADAVLVLGGGDINLDLYSFRILSI
jgi:Xaa-Pro aminopeptidase